MGQPTGGATVGEGDYALQLGKAEGVGIRAVIVSMVIPLAVVTIFTCRAIPDGVGRVELFAEMTSVWKREGFSRAAGLCIIIVVLWHGVPLEAMTVSIFYSCGQGHSTSAHGFRPIVIRNESAMVKVGKDTRNNPSFSESSPSFCVPDPPACSFIC